MSKAKPLTAEQKQICRENSSTMFADQITQLPGMEGTTKRQVADYLRTPDDNKYAIMADMLEQFIASDGLPRQYSAVIGYVRYLRSKA